MDAEQIRKEREEAEKFLDDAFAAANAEHHEEGKPEDKPGEIPPVVVKEGAGGTDVHDEHSQDDLGAAAQIQALQGQVERLVAQLEDENSQTFKSRYLSLEGRFNQVVAELRELKDHGKEESAVKKDIPPDKDFEELVTDFGEEPMKRLNSFIDKRAEARAAEIVAEKTKDFGEKVTNFEQSQHKVTMESFITKLDTICPEWKKINGWEPDKVPMDPKFDAFLDTYVPGTRMTYNDVIRASSEAYDAEKVVEVFDLFKKANAASTEKPGAVKDVGKYVEAGKTGRGNTPPVDKDNNKKTYAQKDIDAFDKALNEGKIFKSDPKVAALWQEYQDAIWEGRVK